jgi:WD40 repeat protein
MVGQPPGRTFISYSRKDGAAFATWLRGWLDERYLSVWQDVVALEGGRDWWSQIEDALKSKALQHFIFVVTPAALASPYVRREIRLARQEGKTSCPVKGPGLSDLGELPRWLGQIYDLDLVEHQTTLIRVLEADSRQKRVPMMAPEPPNDFVPRPKEFDALKQQLLDAKGDAVAGITAGLKGAGGYGKTTLAKALAHDPDIQDAFFDGILWAELGEKPERLLATLSDLIELLTGERPGLETISAAAAKLGETLGDRRILMVVDDAWREQDLRPFLQGGPNCVRVVTTRIDSVLPRAALRQPVDAMQAGEALRLLSAGLPEDQVAHEGASLTMLAARLGEWAQILKIVNGFLRDRVFGARQPLHDAIAGVNKRLDSKGLVAFDPREETDRAKVIARTIGVSLELLTEQERARFGELGIFPEDADIPIGVVAYFWATTAGLPDLESEDFLGRLFDLSLLLNFDLGQRFFRLHDTIRHFLQNQADKERLVAQNKALIAALEGMVAPTAEVDARSLRYACLYLPHHLAEAGEREKLDALLLDPGWLKAKLEGTHDPESLVADYQRFGAGEAHSLVGRTLRLITGVLTRDAHQLPAQLIGRLEGVEAVATTGFVQRARQEISPPAIVPIRPSLTPPGAETLRLEGHENNVLALCPLPNGLLASGSDDYTIRLWDVTTGAETARLEGHKGSVEALCLLPNGRLIASRSQDQTIRLWDVATNIQVACLPGYIGPGRNLCALPDGRLAWDSDNAIWLRSTEAEADPARFLSHPEQVRALSGLPNGRLASASDDGTIRLWDVTTHTEIGRLEGSSRYVTALCLLPDGRLASASDDRTIRLWDVTTHTEIGRLEGSSRYVTALCLLPDGRLASTSDDTIQLWDIAAGLETARLTGHTHWVSALCGLPDGRLASGSNDNTIRLWDATRSTEIGRPAGRAPAVTALCSLPDGRIASAEFSGRTIRLWNATTGAEISRLAGHTSWVSALCALPDGRLASGSDDNTIRLWDAATGAETSRLAGHFGSVSTLCLLADGRLASGSDDRTIRLWDMANGVETARLTGHGRPVPALCSLRDGRLASASSDGKIRLWDVAAGVESARFKGFAGRVTALCLLADGRLASASDDGTIRLWDLVTRAETARYEGRAGASLCLLPDGRLASGSYNDKTVRLWDMNSSVEIARLELDAPVSALVAPGHNLIVAGDSVGRLHWLEVVD